MFSERRLFTGGLLAALAVAWIFVALWTPNGFSDLLRFLGPAMLLGVAVAWLFFTFAGNLFTWPRAIRSVVAGAAFLTPVLAYFFGTSEDPDLVAKFLFMIAIGWAASLGGTLWSLGGAAADAYREWRATRRMRRPRKVYVPAETSQPQDHGNRKMRTSRLFVAISTAALLAGCASRPTPVAVIGASSDLSALVGDWSGEYSSPETGRSGSIAFTLKSGKDTAFGSVVMVPKVQSEPVTPSATAERPIVRNIATENPAELLTIRFVRMEGSQVIGTLDPYRDPDCGCQLTTTFRGRFTDARTIEGTFNSAGSGMGHLPSSGRWKVTRVVP